MPRSLAPVRLVLPIAFALSTGVNVCTAQCDIFRENVPDFDQVRITLPNLGVEYCVPTSACDFLAYISNHGVPSVLGGPFNWQLAQYYDYVSTQIAGAADYMQTDENTGTTSDHAKSGLQSLLDDRAPDIFSVSTKYGYISPMDLYNLMADGHLVMMFYGYYQLNSSNEFSRTGGHCVALTGILNACGNGTPTFRYRNPHVDLDPTSQSTFVSTVSPATPVSFRMSSGVVNRMYLYGATATGDRIPCLDGFVAIRTNFALLPSPTSGSWVRYDFLNTIRVPAGVVTNYTTGNSRTATGSALSPDGGSMYYTTTSESAVADIIPVYRQSLSDGTSTRLMTLVGPSPIALDRFGDLYVFNSGLINRFDTSGPTPVLVASAPTSDGLAPDTLAWDDTHDQLVALSQSARRMDLFNRDLTIAGGGPISARVTFQGHFRADVAPGGVDYLVGSTGAGLVYDFRFNNGPNPVTIQTLAIPGASSVQAVQVGSHGRLYVMADVGVCEFARNSTSGLWELAATTQFGALPVANGLLISRGRTNYDPALYGTPDWQDVYYPQPTTATIRDCAVDQNLDGVVTVQDIFVFIQRWFSGARAGDFNESGSLTVQDIFDFIAAWFVGCP